MSELGGPEIGAPSEDGGSASESLSEEAAARFAAAAAAGQQARKDEQRAKKRDGGVAHVILQFLTDEQKAHLATLISRLVARDCPSPFILAVLSLINAECAKAVDEFLADKGVEGQTAMENQRSLLPPEAIDAASAADMTEWLTRLELTLQTDTPAILGSLIVEEGNLDGTILQLTTFVLQEFLHKSGKDAEFEKLQTLSASILQSLFAPYMHLAPERILETTDDQA